MAVTWTVADRYALLHGRYNTRIAVSRRTYALEQAETTALIQKRACSMQDTLQPQALYRAGRIRTADPKSPRLVR